MSSNIIYTSLPSLLESCSTIQTRIAMIESILDQLSTAMLTAASTAHYEEYRLDTGQTKTEIKFKGMNEITLAYNALVMRLDREYAKLGARVNGRVFRLVDGKNFRSGI